MSHSLSHRLTIKLSFYGICAPQLTRLEFSHPLLTQPNSSVRGKSSLFDDSAYTFQWSKAVRAMSLLLVSTVFDLQRLKTKSIAVRDDCYLSGRAGSLANALDLALTKQPDWLSVFGKDSFGRSLAHRIFLRANANRKRPGDVVVGLHRKLLEPGIIEIWLNGRKVEAAKDLELIKQGLSIEGAATRAHAGGDSSDKKFARLESTENKSTVLSEDTCVKIFHSECIRAFEDLQIFSKDKEKKKILATLEDPSFRLRSGLHAKVLGDSIVPMEASERLGLLREEHLALLKDFGKVSITAAVPITSPASTLLLEGLGALLPNPVAVDTRFPHAVEIMHQLQRARIQPDFVTLGIAPSAALMKTHSSEYLPLMFLPTLAHEVLAPHSHGHSPRLEGDFHFLDESTALFMYEDLLRNGKIDPRLSRISKGEPWEELKALRSADKEVRTISFFPYSSVARQILPVRTIATGLLQEQREMILFVHKRLYHSQAHLRALRVALHKVWLELRIELKNSPSLIQKFVRQHQVQADIERFAGTYLL